MSSLTVLDIVILAVYMLGTLLLGCWFYFRSRDSQSFTSANGSIPSVIVGLSIFGTYVSSISFLANPGSSYVGNWTAFVLSLTIIPLTWIAAKYFVPFYRECGSVSAYAHLEDRFGCWARIYGTICYMLTQLARMGSILFLLALPLHQLFGWNIALIIIVVGLTTIIYSMIGGITGVIYVDALQSAVLILGALTCALIIPFSMPEGPGQLFRIAMSDGKFSLGSLAWDLTPKKPADNVVWVVLLYGIIINFQNFGVDQNYVQRYLTARSVKAARRSLWIGTLLFLPVSAFFFFIGTALYAFYKVRPELLTDAEIVKQVGAGNGDSVFPFFIVHQLPAGVTGLLIAAIVAAAMSTVSTSLNGTATLTLTDFYTRFFNPQASEKKKMFVLYFSTCFWGIAGILCALLMIRARGILDAYWVLAGIFSGGIVGIFLLGIFTRRANSRGTLVGMLVGLILILWMTLGISSGALKQYGLWADWMEVTKSPFHSYLINVFGTVTVMSVGFIFSLLMPDKKRRENKKIG